jgi:predicted metal-dependent HD superfamily phosphohydrolase
MLRSRDGNFITYDFYSEQAWIDMLVETQVQERLAPIEQAEREAALNREVERRVQERMTVEATLRQMRGTEVASIYRVVDTVAGLPVYVGHTKKRVDVRIQEHVRQALAFSGEPRFHAFLRQRIEEQRLPTIQVVRQVFAQDARAEETREIRRLITEGISLFNKESMQATTRARMQMGEIQLLIEKTGGL